MRLDATIGSDAICTLCIFAGAIADVNSLCYKFCVFFFLFFVYNVLYCLLIKYKVPNLMRIISLIADFSMNLSVAKEFFLLCIIFLSLLYKIYLNKK